MNEINKSPMKIAIDKNKCIACGLCSQLYPETFEFDDNEAKVIGSVTKPLKEIIDSCPSGAISISDNIDSK